MKDTCESCSATWTTGDDPGYSLDRQGNRRVSEDMKSCGLLIRSGGCKRDENFDSQSRRNDSLWPPCWKDLGDFQFRTDGSRLYELCSVTAFLALDIKSIDSAVRREALSSIMFLSS